MRMNFIVTAIVMQFLFVGLMVDFGLNIHVLALAFLATVFASILIFLTSLIVFHPKKRINQFLKADEPNKL